MFVNTVQHNKYKYLRENEYKLISYNSHTLNYISASEYFIFAVV